MFGDRLGHLTEESLELPLPLGGDLSFLGRFQALASAFTSARSLACRVWILPGKTSSA